LVHEPAKSIVILHEKGIYHYDIKKGNIVQVDNELKIIDFEGPKQQRTDDLQCIPECAPYGEKIDWYRFAMLCIERHAVTRSRDFAMLHLGINEAQLQTLKETNKIETGDLDGLTLNVEKALVLLQEYASSSD